MSSDEQSHLDLRPLLDRVESSPPVEILEVAEDELAALVGATSVSVLLLEHNGRAMVRFDRSTWTTETGRSKGVEYAESIELADTVYQRVLTTQRVDAREIDGGARLTVPVTVRGDLIGLLQLTTPALPDTRVLADLAAVGRTLGYAIVASRRYTDLFEWGQRSSPLTLAAEIQRRLLPSAFTLAARQFSLAGWLEPANTVGGDTFDYSLDRDTLHLSITDAVGHDVHAAMLATVLVGSLRNGRRRGMSLADQTRTANDALAAHSPEGHFVTGQVLRVDLRGGDVTVVNAGHPRPLLLRAGQVREVPLDIDIPFGLYPGREFRLQRFRFEPGDRMVLVTDGVLDRNSAMVDVPAILRDTARLTPRELVHALGDAVLEATGGDLRDDSTMLCIDWSGAH
jgi:serine phosphatase RsbU (regulator of sigma subunit)